MKHLKKLSVAIMMVTLFSVTFTSCIDNEVSDAVDQVYLAQAGFLEAQAALKNAEAQFKIAQAATEAANAQLVLANAASVQAATAGVIITNSLNAGLNANTLSLAAANLATNLATAAGQLAAAQSANQVAMVNLSNAVAAAKNVLLTGLMGDYRERNLWLDFHSNAKLVKLGEIANQELYLAAGGTESMAFVQAQLVANLASLEAGLVSANAEIVRLQGLSASTAQQDVTALQAQKAALNTSRNALGVTLAVRENAVEVAKAAWIKASTDNSGVNTKKGEIATLEGVIAGHNTDKANAQAAIDKANANIAALPAAIGAEAAVTFTAAESAISAQIALIGYSSTGTMLINGTAPTATSTPKTGTTLNDVWFNKAIDARKADKAFNDATQLIANLGLDIRNLETALGIAQTNLNPVSAATLLTNLNAWEAATAAEEAAQNTWEANPNGSTWTDGTDTNAGTFTNPFVGDHSDAFPNSYRQVLTWGTDLLGAFYPLTYSTTSIPAIPVAVLPNTHTIFNGTGLVAAPIATNIYFVEVENDDVPSNNYNALQTARNTARLAETTYTAGLALNATRQATYNTALLAVQEAYIKVGAAWATGGFIDLADYQAIIAYIGTYDTAHYAGFITSTTADDVANTSTGLGALQMTAQKAEFTALTAVNSAVTKLGTDFRPAATTFVTQFDVWKANSAPIAVITGAALTGGASPYTNATNYQQLTGVVNAAGDVARIYRLPFSATASATTLYQLLRNEYFKKVWAQEAVTALQTVTYTAINPAGDLGNTNAKTITEATADIAYINTLLPSHIAALAQLNAELAVLVAAAGNLDLLLFDPQDHMFSYTVDGASVSNLGYIPLLVTYLNAVVARNVVSAQMAANLADQVLIQNSIDHVVLYLLDGSTTGTNVATFNTWRNNAIAAQRALINGTTTPTVTDGYIKDIEQAKVLIAKGLITKANAVLLLDEMKRELAVIETHIKFNKDSAASILARINAILAS